MLNESCISASFIMTVQRYKKFQYKPNIFRIIFELFLDISKGATRNKATRNFSKCQNQQKRNILL